MRICVFGAGAVGGHLAARLARAGATVSVVTRGEQLRAIQAQGLTVHAADGTLHARVAAADRAEALGQQDAVIVTLKAPALPSLAAGIGPLLGPETPVLFAMNGIPWWYFHAVSPAQSLDGALRDRRLPAVDPEGLVWSAVGPRRALGGVIYSACTVVSPGVIEVQNPVSRLVIGEPDGTLSARAEAIAALLRDAGMDAPVTDRIRDAIWAKLLLNLSSGLLCVLAQAPSQDVFREPACAAAAQRIMLEGAAIARALGCVVAPDLEARVRPGPVGRHLPSVAQDLALGRPMEVAAMFDLPLELARLTGVETPTLDLLVPLVRARARSAGLYPAA